MATTEPRIVVEPGYGTLEIFPFEPTEETLYRLFSDLFSNHWNELITIFLPNPFYSNERPTN